MSSNHKRDWLNAMADEFSSLTESHAWEIVTLPYERAAIPVTWTYYLRVEYDKNVTRLKAWLAGKGFGQIGGVDLSKVISPVSKYSTVRRVLALLISISWTLVSLEVERIFCILF